SATGARGGTWTRWRSRWPRTWTGSTTAGCTARPAWSHRPSSRTTSTSRNRCHRTPKRWFRASTEPGTRHLHLGAAGEQVDHPGELGQAEHAGPGQVAHVGGAAEGHHVVLAQRGEGDVALQDELAVAALVGEGRQVESGGAEQFDERLCHTARGAPGGF